MTSYTGLRLEPVSALGVNVLENGSVHWNAARQFFYPVGLHIRHYHLETNQTQFLFPERFGQNCTEIIKICDVAVTSNGQFIAISEVFRPNHGILSIYDTESQVAHVHLRHDDVTKFSSLAFTTDGGMVGALGITKDENRVFVWKMGRQVSLAAMIPVKDAIKKIGFDPQDSFRLLLFGSNVITTVLINTIDKVQKNIEIEGINQFDQFTFVSAVPGLLLVSSQNFLITIMNDQVIEVTDPINSNITILKSIRNFVFLINDGIIHFYKANATAPYLTYIGPLSLQCQNITDFSPSPDGDLAIIFHDDSFVGLLDLNVGQKIIKQQAEQAENENIHLAPDQEDEINEFLNIQTPGSENQMADNVVDNAEMQQFMGLFTPLPIRYHIGPIVAIATCPRKPLLATCGGQDRTLLVWNLAKKCVIASEKLTEPVNSCSFHPSGDLLAVGTSEKLLLYSLTFDSLVLRAKWESLSCTCVSFSNGGHLLAAGALIIKVIATYSAKTVTSLRGHNLSVKSIQWAMNDAFFVSSGLDGNVFKWPAKSWDRQCEVSLPSQCISALLSPSSTYEESTNKLVASHNILVATSNNTIYDMELKCERLPKRKLNITAICLPVHFSMVSGDQRGNVQVIPYPLLPAGEENPFHIGLEVAVHTAPVHCIMSSSDGQTLFTASEDSSIFIFNIVQPHQMVIAAPVALALSREEQSFLIERDAFEEKKETLSTLRGMLNLHRSQFQCAKTKLNERQSRDIVQQKNKWQMTLCSLKKQVHALTKQKQEQEKKATEIIAESDNQHFLKIRAVKELYEQKLTEQTKQAAELMKEKIRIQCEYEEKLHQMTERYKTSLQEKREAAQKQLEAKANDNVEKEKEFKQIERLQDEERITLQHEHEMEMDLFRQQFEAKIAELNNRIDVVRTDLVGHQDAYDGNLEQKSSFKAAIQRTHQENQALKNQKKNIMDQISQLKTELAARGDRVARQTNNLLQLKSRNDELQKWRQVMDHKLTDLKQQVEPKSHKIEELRVSITTNEALLRQMKLTSGKDADSLEKMEVEIKTLYNEFLKAENSSSKCEATINQFKNKVHAIYTEIEPDKWASEISKLYKEFVTNEKIEEDDQALADTLDEFERHKTALAEKVVELRLKVEDDTENSGFSFLKQINKNEDLIAELARIRKENRKLKSDLHLAQTTFNTLLRQCSRESKTLEAKVKTMFRSSNIICKPDVTIQRRVTKTGTSMTVEHFS